MWSDTPHRAGEVALQRVERIPAGSNEARVVRRVVRHCVQGLQHMRELAGCGLRQSPGISQCEEHRFEGDACATVAIISVQDGHFEFTLENLPQPPVFRNWVRW